MTTPQQDDSWLNPANVIGLMMGRAAFRVAGYGAGLFLLAHWDQATFAQYAGAVGAMGWLLTLTAGGTEKAAQTFLPRDDDRRLERFFIWAACTPYTVALSLWIVTLAVNHDGDLARYLAAAALPCGVGACSVLIALFRMRRRPGYDALVYLHLSVGYIAGALAVAGLDLDVIGLFAVLNCWQLTAVVGLLLLLRRVEVGTGAAPARRWEALRAIPLLSLGELAGTAGVAVLYVLLTWGADDDAIGTFYVMAVAASIVAMAWLYLLRLAQPSLVRRIVGDGPADILRRGRRMARWTVLVGTVGAAGLGATMSLGADGPAVLGGLVGLEIGLFVGATSCAFVLENMDARGRGRAAVTAVAQFVTIVAAGALLVPASGAAGAFLAMSLGLLAKVALLAVFIDRHATVRPTARADRADFTAKG